MSHHVPRAEAKKHGDRLHQFHQQRPSQLLLHTAKIDVPDQEPTCLVVISGDLVCSGPPGRSFKFPFAIEAFTRSGKASATRRRSRARLKRRRARTAFSLFAIHPRVMRA